MSDIESKTNHDKFILPTSHIIQLLGLHAVLLIILLLLSTPFLENTIVIICFMLLSPFFGLWQTNIFAPKEHKRSYHFQSRLVYALLFSLSILFYLYIVEDKSFPGAVFLFLFAALLVYSGLFSLIIFYLQSNLLTSNRYYFQSKLYLALPITLLFIFSSFTLKEGWFNSNYYDIKKWSDTDPITYDDFNGYPNFFTSYDAEIKSTISYFFDSNDQIKYIDAICYTGETWVNPFSRGSYSLLQHEAYHFKITEMVARMARKEVRAALNLNKDREAIAAIIWKHIYLLRDYQNKYDTETDHSLIEDKQSEWQYKVDSILFELDPYWTSAILLPRADSFQHVRFYRNLKINYKFELFAVNELMPNEENYANHYRLIYHEDSTIKEILYYSKGKRAIDNYFESSRIVINRSNPEILAWEFFDEYDQPIINNEGYQKREMKYLTKNQVMVSHFDIYGSQIKDIDNIYNINYLLDDLGRTVKGTYLNEKGEVLENKNSVAITKYSFRGENSYPYLKEFFDKNEIPTLDKDGVFQYQYSYNQDGHITSLMSLDILGKPAYTDNYMTKKYSYDELGRLKTITHFDEHNKLAEDEDGIAVYNYSDDRYGKVNRISLFNRNNVLKENEDGHAIKYFKYNDDGHLLLEAYYDSGVKLIFDDEGYGKVLYTYDSLGRKKTITNLNGYDYPFSRDGMGEIQVLEYDTINKITRSFYTDRYGNKTTTDLGEAAYESHYDSSGNMISHKQYDLEGNLFSPYFNTAIYRYKYDSDGNKIQSSFYTTDDKPSTANGGVFINNYVYNEKNQMIERSYLDTNNQLIKFDGAAKIQWAYDSKGNIIESVYYNEFNQLITEGAAIVKSKYDHHKNVIEEKEYDHQKKLLSFKKLKWNNDNQIVRVERYADNNVKAVDEDGIHVYEYSYKNGFDTGEKYLDTSGNLVEFENIAFTVLENDTYGNVIKKSVFDKFGKLALVENGSFAVITYRYDEYDRLVELNYFDEKNKPALIEGNYSRVRFKLDNSGNVLWKGYFNPDGELTTNEDNVALYRSEINRNTALEISEDLTLDQAKVFINQIDWQ